MLIIPSSTGAAAAVAPTESTAASNTRADAAIVALFPAVGGCSPHNRATRTGADRLGEEQLPARYELPDSAPQLSFC